MPLAYNFSLESFRIEFAVFCPARKSLRPRGLSTNNLHFKTNFWTYRWCRRGGAAEWREVAELDS